MSVKQYQYPYPEDDAEIKRLMEVIQRIDDKRKEMTDKLRKLIYKIEKPR